MEQKPTEVTTLGKILENIKSLQSLADFDLTEWDWTTRPGKEIQKSQAKRDLVPLRATYLKEFSNRTAKVFVDGTPEQVATFITLLNKEGGYTFTSPNIYDFLATMVVPKLSLGSTFSSAAWGRLNEVLGDICRTYEVYPHTMPQEPNSPQINSNADLVGVIKGVVRKAFGDTLNRVYLTSNFLNEALTTKFDKDVAIVVVAGLSDEEKSSVMETLFPGQPNFSLSMAPDETPDKSTALKVYRRVFEAFNSKKSAKKVTTVETHSS